MLSAHLSGVDVDVGNDQVDDREAECATRDGHPVHQGVRYLKRSINVVTIFSLTSDLLEV